MSARTAGRRTVWRAPAWLCPDVRGIADPGQTPDANGTVELHREQYVSWADADHYLRFLNPIPVGHGWTFMLREENHPGDIPLTVVRVRRLASGGVITNQGPDWPHGVIGILLTPGGMRLDRGRLDHPKKRLRDEPTRLVLGSSGWRGIRGPGPLVLVRRGPHGGGTGLGLHRLARHLRELGEPRPALLLNDGRLFDGAVPSDDDIEQFVRYGASPSRLVHLGAHEGGPGLRTGGRGDLPSSVADLAGRFVSVVTCSVRKDLLRDPAEVDRIAGEVAVVALDATSRS